MRTLACALLLATLPLFAADTPVATILCYHEVDDAVTHATIPRAGAPPVPAEMLRYTAGVASFREQLDYLADHGYHVIPLATLVDFLAGKTPSIPEPAVVITVDDGWECAYSEIAGELRKRDLPWTLFVYPKIVSHGIHAVTWPQLVELARDGVDVESHTLTHPDLTKSAATLDDELAGSRKKIETQIGKPVRFLSYPYGAYDPSVIDAARRDGYEAAVTTRRAPITRATPLMELTRYLIHNDTTLEEFKTFLPPPL
jgi:peptidoglycan/xylan/chitin deacetylase (PgdA/CDA1 family)